MMHLAVLTPNSQKANSQAHWELRSWGLGVDSPSRHTSEAT
jgi:hypothetical protein